MITLKLPISSVLNLMATSKSLRNSLMSDIDLIAKNIAMRPTNANVDGGRQWCLPVRGEQEAWLKDLTEAMDATTIATETETELDQGSVGDLKALTDLFPHNFPWYSYLRCCGKTSNWSMRNRRRIWEVLQRSRFRTKGLRWECLYRCI